MPIECLISFDNNTQGVYYAGQELSGVVDLTVDTTKRIKAIHITVNGYAKIRWIKKGYPRDSERAMCRAYRSYLSSRSYVLGSCGVNSYLDWMAGEYSYTFHVILPENLPTSFDGKYGQIHYEIITTIDRPGRYPKVFKLPFTVIHPVDLNSDAIYRVPLEILDRKRFWSFCCPTGPLTVKFSTPYCGYAPGQKIHFVLYINNESSIDITACDVKLKQEVTYETHDPQHEYRYDKHLIASKQFGNVLRWSRKVYRGYLELPSIPPTSAKTSCPITVNYAMKIVIKPTEFHWKMKLKVPVTIGSVPIMDSSSSAGVLQANNNSIMRAESVDEPQVRAMANEQLLDNEGNENTTPTIMVTDADNPPDYIQMMPPSYEDAMALSEKFFDDLAYMENVSVSSVVTNSKNENFKPRYPVYYYYETPIIPPETLYDAIPSRYHPMVLATPMSDMSPTSLELSHVKTFGKFQILRYMKK
ncbi:arrestin domain-containing protein 17 [Stomoxys calcitrans]|uniref:Arrestin C-terminal-like domain-containing protein n=1 Tax=Stomoxys calcitrans TaxID=35570 RepID=A0A1I8Q2Q7_STOCA|nr:arrestin domain-containing protein 17 [Stomoxys calcitrans]